MPFLADQLFPGGACRKDFEAVATDFPLHDFIVLPEVDGDEGLTQAVKWAWMLDGFLLATGALGSFSGYSIQTASTNIYPGLLPVGAVTMHYPVSMVTIGTFDPATIGTSRTVAGTTAGGVAVGTGAAPIPPARVCLPMRGDRRLWSTEMQYIGPYLFGDATETYSGSCSLAYDVASSRWRVYYSFKIVCVYDYSPTQRHSMINPSNTLAGGAPVFFSTVTNSVGMEFDYYDDSGNVDPMAFVGDGPEPLFLI